MKDLKVISVRYFETRRGLGYECKTNIPNVTIWNDGCGRGTYFENCMEAKYHKLYDLEKDQDYMEGLIDDYESLTREPTPADDIENLKAIKEFLKEKGCL